MSSDENRQAQPTEWGYVEFNKGGVPMSELPEVIWLKRLWARLTGKQPAPPR